MSTSSKKLHRCKRETSLAVEIPKQAIIVLFFVLFSLFVWQAWSDGRVFGSYELLVLLGVRSGGGFLFWWLEIDD